MTKVTSLREAVARLVPDATVVALGLGLESNIPFAAGFEIARQRKRDLTLIGPISDILFDLLIGAGCVREVWAAWVGNVSEGSAYQFRRAVEERSIVVRDYSNFTLSLALQAAAWGVPFLPTRAAQGSELVETQPDRFRTVESPFSKETVLAVRAVRPDLAILHVQRSDADGNAHLWGNLGITSEGARAADHVLLTCEELVGPDVIRADPNRTVVPGYLVDAVVEVPYGAHPSPCPGFYDRDHEFFAAYHAATRTDPDRWNAEWVGGVRDHSAYLRKVGLRP